jgi:hypothetical protein
LNRQAIESGNELVEVCKSFKPGQKVRVRLLRDGKLFLTTITAYELPAQRRTGPQTWPRLETPPASSPAVGIAPSSPTSSPTASAPANAGSLSITGTYFGKDPQGITHFWDFNADGSFLHRWKAGASLGSVSNSERGSYSVSGSTLTLALQKAATSFSQASVTSPGKTVYGGGEGPSGTTRTAQVQIGTFDGERGLVLDGVDLNARHGW